MNVYLIKIKRIKLLIYSKVPKNGNLNKQRGEGGGSKNSVKYNKRGHWNKCWRRLFLYCDPNDVNVSKFAYVQTKL